MFLQKSTKTALETGRTFSTLFADLEFRFDLQNATSEYEFKKLLRDRTKHLIKEHGLPENRKSHLALPVNPFEDEGAEVKMVSSLSVKINPPTKTAHIQICIFGMSVVVC